MNINPNQIPFSQEAENYVLGALIINPELKHDTALELSTSDFYNSDSKSIYSAIMAIDFIDLIQVSEYLLTKKVSFDPYERLTMIMAAIPSTQAIKHNIRIVKEKSICRKIINSAYEVIEMAESGVMDFETAKGEIFKKFDIEIIKEQMSETMSELVNDFDRMMESRKQNNGSFKRWGIPWLDKRTMGMWDGQLILLAARPSVGKSTLGMQVAKYNAFRQLNILYFSLEMSSVSFIEKIISSETMIDSNLLRQPQLLSAAENKRIKDSGNEIKKMNLRIFDKIFSLEHVMSKTRQLHSKNKIDIVFIDHIHIMRTSHKAFNQNDKLGYISGNLKLFAKELGIPIVALAQLKRLDGVNPEPNLSDLRDSGSLEQDADTVIFLHDPLAGKYQEQPKQIVALKLIIAKQREGERDISKVVEYNRPVQRISQRED
jgi:replicative DNA helicase